MRVFVVFPRISAFRASRLGLRYGIRQGAYVRECEKREGNRSSALERSDGRTKPLHRGAPERSVFLLGGSQDALCDGMEVFARRARRIELRELGEKRVLVGVARLECAEATALVPV